MRKRDLYQNMLLCGILVFLLFGSFFANSNTTQEEEYWGPLRETYTYIWDDTHYNYNLENPLIENYEEITIWDVESEENEISFRTNKLTVFMGMIHCESQACYDLYRAAWLYENETESFKVTYRYDNITQEIGFVDPISLDLMSSNLGVPVNMMEIHVDLFMFWRGFGFTFLPVLSSNFSFQTDYEIYELAYKEFEIEFKDSFKFQRKKFEGYHYRISYVYEGSLYPGVSYREEVCRYYSYNVQGVLYEFYNDYKFSTNITGDFEVETEGVFKYYIDSYDEVLVVAHSWVYGIGAFIVTSTVIVYKRRKK
ncbi:MAG: hypothetical protein GOP50_07370 [Candidatus Heimdallarchaeota archaeon]|nr:hypothetical protein [Candidatus Heimdallarchaeota archaeon]